MTNYLGKIKIGDKIYSANLQTDLKSTFKLKILEYSIRNENKIDIAIGLFEGLGEITLVSGYVSRGRFGNIDIQELDFSYLIKGVQFTNLNLIKANILNFESEILKKVFYDTVLSIEGVQGNIDRKPVYLLKSSKLRISFYNGLRTGITRQMEFKAFQYKYLNIKVLGGALPIWDLIQIAGRLKKMIYLLGLSDVDIEEVFTFILYNGKQNKKFQLYGWDYRLSNLKFAFFQNFNLNFVDFFSDEMVQDWIFNESFQEIFDTLYERHFLKNASYEISFLNSAFALEKFHRTFIEKVRSFDKRVKFFRDSFESVLPVGTDVAVYLNRIVQTRHSLSHFDSKPQAFIGVDLLYASVYIEAVLVIAILKKLGVKDDNLDKLTLYSRKMIDSMYTGNKSLQFTYPSNLFHELR